MATGAAAAAPFRDLLGHLCAEIERQQVQIGEQGCQIEELLQENEELRAALEAARYGCPEGAAQSEAAWSAARPSPSASTDERACRHSGSPDGFRSVACQTACCEDFDRLAPENGKLHIRCFCDRGMQSADGAAADKLQQPEPAPEPLAPAACPSQAPSGRCAEEVDLEMDVLRGALVRESPELADVSLLDTQTWQRTNRPFGETQHSELAPNNCSADSEAPQWTLSPTSIDSDASSPMWLGLCSGELPTSPKAAAASTEARTQPQQAVAEEARREEAQRLGKHRAQGLRRQPHSAEWSPSEAARPLETGGGAGGGLCGGGASDSQRLVRSILDALDAAQKRLQQSSRRRGARRAAPNGAGPSSCAQVDIRIYVPGPSGRADCEGPGPSGRADCEGSATDGAPVKRVEEQNRVAEDDEPMFSPGSFMYILL